ncbi:MAG: hypothetical protein CHACPFDD_02838 [Phycisphaerae bacterium]|nr:hypothetical protein [Phycisphaerae bacterium]
MFSKLTIGTVLAFQAACATPALACTVFKVTIDGRTYGGNNEAWTDPNTKVWFLAAEPGKYGRVYFGYRNGFAQGGMNERGLFYDWVAGYQTGWKRDPNKLDYPGNFSEKVLEEAATVDEAIALYERYFETTNDASFAAARALLADRSGASAVVGCEDGRLKITRGDGPCQTLGWDQDATQRRLLELVERHAGAAASRPAASSDTAASSAADDVIDAVSGVLSACQQSGKYTTFYSNVYDLSAGEVHIYQFHGKVPAVTIHLRRELAKGSHCYDLPKIVEQMKLPPAVDGRMLPRVAVDPARYAALAGTFELAPGLRLDVIERDRKLFVQFPGEPAYELFAASDTKFFLGFVDVQLSFTLDAAGAASSVAFHSWDKDLTGVRVAPGATQPSSAPQRETP